MRFLLHLKRCYDKCHAEARTRGEVFASPYYKKVAEDRLAAIDYIYAFMGSAIDYRYPFLEGGFKNNLSPMLKKCFEVTNCELNGRSYLLGLRSAARKLGIPTEQLQLILNRIDDVARVLAKSAVKDIMKAKTDREIKFAKHSFEVTVVANKNLILNLR